MYTCADCVVQACGEESPEKLPANCPMREQKLMEEAFSVYGKEEVHDFYVMSSAVEALGYGQWTRLKETAEFCRRMGYKKVGLAFCRGLKREAKVVAKVLRSYDLTVFSVICKAGGIDKERAGIPREQKVHPEAFEPMCNPAAQAMLMNSQKTEFNIALGLCVGHDSLFYRYSHAYVTTLVAKDRVLSHNPCGAIYTAEGYYKTKLEP